MEATTLGMNRTGAKVSPAGTQAMNDAVTELTPEVLPIDTAAIEAERITYINDAESVGSIPPPASVKGVVKSGMAKLKGGEPSLLMDKLGERIAVERGATRLYEALIAKHQAVEVLGEVLPRADEVLDMTLEGMAALAPISGESPAQTLLRIRNEEHEHFLMLCEAMEKLGGDPTAMTPCADVSATASMGLMQVMTDPRTTLAQSLNAILIAEMTDNAGWELLVSLAEQAGEEELAGRFLGALAQEQEHLAITKGWLVSLVSNNAGTPAV